MSRLFLVPARIRHFLIEIGRRSRYTQPISIAASGKLPRVFSRRSRETYLRLIYYDHQQQTLESHLPSVFLDTLTHCRISSKSAERIAPLP